MKSELASIAVVIVIIFSFFGCGGGGGGGGGKTPQADSTALTPPDSVRDWLTSEELLSNQASITSPIHNDYFVSVASNLEAKHDFSGSLSLNSTALSGSVHDASFGESGIRVFPDVELNFITHEGHLLPTERQILIPNNNSYWHIILSPGNVWSEEADGDWSRAAFPFILIHKQRNEAHNGIATFLYNNNSTSQLRLQVVQETASWSKIDLWAQFSVNYETKTFISVNEVIEAFQLEETNRLSTGSWDELSQLVGSSTLSRFNSGLVNGDISMTGIIMDGTIYHQPCYTRYGNYPFCHQMRQGAYSATKSMGAAVAMLRLAQKYGDSVFDLYITDYVNITATHGGWDDVTFSDALNMATGIGDNSNDRNIIDIFADENASKMEWWQTAESKDQKLAISFSYANYDWGPAEVFRYNSTHTYVLAAAMDSYYKTMEGDNSYLWDMVDNEVYKPIGISHAFMVHTIEPDDSKGIPVLYVGLYPTMDDIAKLSQLYQNGGAHNGKQLLHQNKTAVGLYQTEQHGLRSYWGDNSFGNSEYLYSFWSEPLTQNGCFVQIPYMSGFGGNIVALLPNGISAFRFADADSYSASDLVSVAANIRSVCE